MRDHEASIDRIGLVTSGIRRRPLSARTLRGPLTLEQRALPGTILAAFIGLLAIQILLAL